MCRGCPRQQQPILFAQYDMHSRLQTLDGGRKRSGIFASDLTLAEVKELYAVQTFKFRDQSYDTRYRCCLQSLCNVAPSCSDRVFDMLAQSRACPLGVGSVLEHRASDNPDNGFMCG